MANKMLIDATHPEETRVVVLRGNRVEEFDFETAHRKQLRGNIYLAKVTRVEPSLQAAFVDYGGNRHGFLAFSEIHPDYYQIPVADRQALIDEEQRAQRAADEEQPDTRRRPQRRGREAAARRRRPTEEAIRGEDELPVEEAAHESDISAGEAALGDLPPEEPARENADSTAPIQPSEAADTAAQIEPSARADTTEEPRPAVEIDLVDPAARELQFDDHIPSAVEPENVASVPEAIPPDASPMLAAEEAPAADADIEPGSADEAAEDETVESVGGADALEEVPDRAPRFRRQYKIQEVIKRRQVLLVQVVKEERGTKGAALTTYLSLAGRYCVLMPNTARGGGISRKITNPEDRKRLREIAERLEVPEGMGVILRTAGANRSNAEIERDFEYLLRQWEQVRDLTLRSTAPTLVYEEGSLIKRAIRDLYTKDIEEIIVAGEEGYNEAKEFLEMLMPGHGANVKLYRDTQPIFTRYNVESQLDAMFSPVVQLKSGGYVVINQTEALVSIDVNSGRSTREHHIEDTALKTNLEAAEEIARQLRLRDLAGLIVIDFIDMDEKRNNRMVERRLKDALRNDRARIQVGRISHFGLLEMSRQRIRTSVLESSTEKCPYCGGTGHMRSVSSVALQLLRAVEEMLLKGATHNITVRTRPEVALYVLNQKRAHLRSLEERFRIAITVHADATINGQVAFAIDRGEQVMTAEQARALAAQAQAALARADEDEREAVAEADFEAEAEDEDRFEVQPQSYESPLGMHEGGQREGGRRRRRRRRRGRGGAGREQAAFAHEVTAEAGAEPPEWTAEAEQDEAQPQEQPHQQPQPAHGEVHGEAHGEGQRRRRRRGRRGGRRNRRERESYGEIGRSEQVQPYPETAALADETQFEAATPAPEPREFAAEPERADHAAPVAAPAAAAAPPAEPAPTPEPPRRRSTVREPAPVTGSSQPVEIQQPAVPSVTIAVQSLGPHAQESEESRPRRTGWWARRLAGDKG
ncbi:MAG TPA: Rne/Rng family ribonuclease [Xanthobacteraceae bacterium]|nr:Rne/Rng family ribonuclease [Xanthobacteraceae bacterium]